MAQLHAPKQLIAQFTSNSATSKANNGNRRRTSKEGDSRQNDTVSSTEVPIPNTPAGQTLRAWLDAFNSDEDARIQAFIQKFAPKQSVDLFIQFRASIGRIDLLSIPKSDRTHIEFQVKQPTTGKTGTAELEVTDAVLPQIVAINFRGLQPLPPPKTEPL